MEFATVLLINVIRIYKFMILARVLLSWFSVDLNHPIVRFLYQLTEPVLAFFRQILPRTGFLDLSPLVAFLVFDLVQAAVLKWLSS